MENIVPIDTFTSMFDEPSRGSNARGIFSTLRMFFRNINQLFYLFGGHSAKIACVIHFLEYCGMGKIVELLDFLALDVYLAGFPQNIDQPGFIDLSGDHFGGDYDLVHQAGKDTGGLRVYLLLLHDVLGDGDTETLWHFC